MSYLFAVIMIVMIHVYIASYMYTYMYIAGCFGLFVGGVSQTLPANVDQHRICMTMIRREQRRKKEKTLQNLQQPQWLSIISISNNLSGLEKYTFLPTA